MCEDISYFAHLKRGYQKIVFSYISYKYDIDFLNLVEYRQIHDQNIIKKNVNIRIISCYI